MILVLLGTNPYPFDRLLLAVDRWSRQAGERVIAQVGHTKVKGLNANLDCYDFVEHERILNWIRQAEFVICQGGFGSIKDCFQYAKPVIAVPRFKKYGECQDSQVELVSELSAEGRLIEVLDVKDLPIAINKIRNFRVNQPKFSELPNFISQAIDNLMND